MLVCIYNLLSLQKRNAFINKSNDFLTATKLSNSNKNNIWLFKR